MLALEDIEKINEAWKAEIWCSSNSKREKDNGKVG